MRPLEESRVLAWDARRWPDFSPRQIACPCCGEVYLWPAALDALESLRARQGAPLDITSGHRCALHNARVGGAPLSQHKRLAFDIALQGHDLARLLAAARLSGFTGFGFGQTFLHLDTRLHPAHWFYGTRSKEKWTSLLSSMPG
jgi:zinc D-Ala-D-Ala carboxypeptidase